MTKIKAKWNANLKTAQLYAPGTSDRNGLLDMIGTIRKPEMAKGYRARMERHKGQYGVYWCSSIKLKVTGKAITDVSIKFDNPEAYDQWMGVWTKIVGDRFLTWLQPNTSKHWIDIGCGNGASTEQILEKCPPSVIDALDLSEDQIKFAKSRKLTELANFSIGDAEALTALDGQYDYAVIALVLFFLSNPEKGVSEMFRVCRFGGQVAGYVWDILGCGLPTNPTLKVFEARGVPFSIPPSSEISTINALRAVFEKSGAKSVETTTFRAERIFASYEDYGDLSSKSNSVSSAVKNFDPKLIEEIKTEVKENLDIDQQRRVKATAHANAVKGKVS